MSYGYFFRTLFALLLALSTVTAHAVTRDQQASACRGDALRLCLIDIPSETKITACMKKKVERLSPDCKSMFDQDAEPGDPSAGPKATTAGQ